MVGEWSQVGGASAIITMEAKDSQPMQLVIGWVEKSELVGHWVLHIPTIWPSSLTDHWRNYGLADIISAGRSGLADIINTAESGTNGRTGCHECDQRWISVGRCEAKLYNLTAKSNTHYRHVRVVWRINTHSAM